MKLIKKYLFWRTSKDYSYDSSHNNNHNHVHRNNYNDIYGVLSKSVDSNPPKIPNDGKKVLLLSMVS